MRPEPRDEALAVFASSHPGREREALAAARVLYRRRKGEPISDAGVARYFGKWDVADLQSQVRLAGSDTRCPDCEGGGWIYDDPADSSKARKCTHPRKVAAG